jgi:RNA polymerase sigma-70 factor (sigma-E family)
MRMDDADEAYIAETTFGAFYRAECRTLVGMLWAFVGDRPTAEDIAHDAFVKVQARWGRLSNPASAPAYLRATAFNLARSRLRHRLVVMRHRPERTPPAASAEDRVLLRAERREVAAALATLPVRQRECVVLRFYDELTEAEIASILRISTSSVKTHLTRAMVGLESRLEGQT